jgi:hypothetical protein
MWVIQTQKIDGEETLFLNSLVFYSLNFFAAQEVSLLYDASGDQIY